MLRSEQGGEKISPLEVDAALLSLEGVGEAVAFGVADEKYGEKVSDTYSIRVPLLTIIHQVWAAIVLRTGAKQTEKALLAACRQKISAFKCPDRIFLLDSIPKTATGKIQRKALAVCSFSTHHWTFSDGDSFQTKFAKEVDESNKPKAKL